MESSSFFEGQGTSEGRDGSPVCRVVVKEPSKCSKPLTFGVRTDHRQRTPLKLLTPVTPESISLGAKSLSPESSFPNRLLLLEKTETTKGEEEPWVSLSTATCTPSEKAFSAYASTTSINSSRDFSGLPQMFVKHSSSPQGCGSLLSGQDMELAWHSPSGSETGSAQDDYSSFWNSELNGRRLEALRSSQKAMAPFLYGYSPLRPLTSDPPCDLSTSRQSESCAGGGPCSRDEFGLSSHSRSPRSKSTGFTASPGAEKSFSDQEEIAGSGGVLLDFLEASSVIEDAINAATEEDQEDDDVLNLTAGDDDGEFLGSLQRAQSSSLTRIVASAMTRSGIEVPTDSNGDPLSVGSMFHITGDCKPCVFHLNEKKGGCVNGVNCMFCHYPHPPRKKPPRPSKRHRMIQRALKSSVAVEQCEFSTPVASGNQETLDCRLLLHERGRHPTEIDFPLAVARRRNPALRPMLQQLRPGAVPENLGFSPSSTVSGHSPSSSLWDFQCLSSRSSPSSKQARLHEGEDRAENRNLASQFSLSPTDRDPDSPSLSVSLSHSLTRDYGGACDDSPLRSEPSPSPATATANQQRLAKSRLRRPFRMPPPPPFEGPLVRAVTENCWATRGEEVQCLLHGLEPAGVRQLEGALASGNLSASASPFYPVGSPDVSQRRGDSSAFEREFQSMPTLLFNGQSTPVVAQEESVPEADSEDEN